MLTFFCELHVQDTGKSNAIDTILNCVKYVSKHVLDASDVFYVFKVLPKKEGFFGSYSSKTWVLLEAIDSSHFIAKGLL